MHNRVAFMGFQIYCNVTLYRYESCIKFKIFDPTEFRSELLNMNLKLISFESPDPFLGHIAFL